MHTLCCVPLNTQGQVAQINAYSARLVIDRLCDYFRGIACSSRISQTDRSVKKKKSGASITKRKKIILQNTAA